MKRENVSQNPKKNQTTGKKQTAGRKTTTVKGVSASPKSRQTGHEESPGQSIS